MFNLDSGKRNRKTNAKRLGVLTSVCFVCQKETALYRILAVLPGRVKHLFFLAFDGIIYFLG
jgi:hypothetical protein